MIKVISSKISLCLGKQKSLRMKHFPFLVLYLQYSNPSMHMFLYPFQNMLVWDIWLSEYKCGKTAF